jgi:NADH dehydrogenase FAD-containing subunit
MDDSYQVIVVGGGNTGVKTAGHLGDNSNNVVRM